MGPYIVVVGNVVEVLVPKHFNVVVAWDAIPVILVGLRKRSGLICAHLDASVERYRRDTSKYEDNEASNEPAVHAA